MRQGEGGCEHGERFMAVTETVEEYENVADLRGCGRWRDDVDVEGGRKIVCCWQARRHDGTDK